MDKQDSRRCDASDIHNRSSFLGRAFRLMDVKLTGESLFVKESIFHSVVTDVVMGRTPVWASKSEVM